MSTTTHWERVEAGRYATEYLGHVLQAVRNPAYPVHDQRPYISVVDRLPLDQACWSLSEAKTKAIRHVINAMGKPAAERNGIYFKRYIPPTFPKPEPKPEPETVTEADEQPRTESDDDGIEALFDDVLALPLPVPEPEAQPEPQPQYVAAVLSEPTTFPVLSITATVTDPDSLRALASIKELLSLMREVADVRCTLRMPEVEL